MMQTTAQVAKLANISVQSVRNYTRTFSELLSPHARGEHGDRLYNEADVEMVCKIAVLRKCGVPPGEIIEQIRWEQAQEFVDVASPQSKEQAAEPTTESTKDDAVEFVPIEVLQATQALMLDAQRRERQLQEQINQLLRELGHKEGELEARRASKPKSFWARLLGRGE